MPEHDITKHTKAIYDTLHESGKTVKEKVTEIFIEIAIIVFAITLSLLLERCRENSHERTTEKKFLLGLKQDLRNDTNQLKSDSAAYSHLLHGWNYMRETGINNLEANKDSIAKYGWSLTNSSDFIANDSRFDALKSSGQLDVIEDDSLKSEILDLYQNKIKVLLTSTNSFTRFKENRLLPFLEKNMKMSKTGDIKVAEFLKTPEMQNYLYMGNEAYEIMQRYHEVIDKSIKIITLINKQYQL